MSSDRIRMPVRKPFSISSSAPYGIFKINKKKIFKNGNKKNKKIRFSLIIFARMTVKTTLLILSSVLFSSCLRRDRVENKENNDKFDEPGNRFYCKSRIYTIYFIFLITPPFPRWLWFIPAANDPDATIIIIIIIIPCNCIAIVLLLS